MAMAVLRTAIFPLAAAGPGRNSLLGPPCCLLLPAGPSTQGIPGPAGCRNTPTLSRMRRSFQNSI
jgi:hypothetical protein